jgi:hypothetical protein
MELGISAILIASTTLVALVAVLIGQLTNSNLPNTTRAKRLLVGSFCCGVIAIALSIAWFFDQINWYPLIISILFFAQMIWFTMVAIVVWWK